MGKNNKPNTCGNLQPANCIIVEHDIPKYSVLQNECDVRLSDVTNDLYKVIEVILEGGDINSVTNIDYLELEEHDNSYLGFPHKTLYIKDALQSIIEKIRYIDGQLNERTTLDNIMDKLDYKCLTGPCGDKPGNFSELMQILIDKNC